MKYILDLAFIETSTRDNLNIDSAFQLMIEGIFIIKILEIYNKFNKQIDGSSSNNTIIKDGDKIKIANEVTEEKRKRKYNLKKCCKP